jgi:ribosomal protein L4
VAGASRSRAEETRRYWPKKVLARARWGGQDARVTAGGTPALPPRDSTKPSRKIHQGFERLKSGAGVNDF